MAFKRSFRIYWFDTDAAGVMHFSNFFRYFEACELEFYRSISLPLSVMREKYDIFLPRVEAHCAFKVACRSDDLIDVSLKVREVTEKTITYDFQIFRQDGSMLAADGSITCIAVNSHWKAVPLPAEVAERIRQTRDS